MGISRKQALDCFRSDDLVGIGMEADAVRRRLHPEGVVSYAMVGRIDCAGLASAASDDSVYAVVGEAVERGAGCLRLLGAVDAERIEGIVQGVRQWSPAVWIEGLTTAEVRSLAAAWSLGLRETITRLMDAGLDSIAEDGVELVDAPGSSHLAEWVEVHRAAHRLGMRTVAAMTFGAGETAEQRMDLLEAFGRLQRETGGFAAFAPVAAVAPGGRELDGVTAVDRMKTLAIGRMSLDTIENVQASGATQGLKVLQMGLRFGANDVGAVDVDGGSEEDVRRIIRDAGFKPAQRELGYRAMLVG